MFAGPVEFQKSAPALEFLPDADLPEIAFQAKTAAAIMVLLVFLFVMNGAAIYLRTRFERRW